MKKIITIVLILLCVCGCINVYPADCAYAQSDTSTIRVWFSSIEEENNAMSNIASKFTAETGIKVDIISRRSVFDAPTDLVNNATLDTRPDIVFMQAPDIGGLVSSGYLSPLEISEDLRSRYVDAAFDAFSLGGKCYGMGYSIDTSGLIYNKNLISEEQLPKTWEEFFTIAEQLTKKDSQGNIIQRGTLLNSRDMWFNYPIIKEYGGYYYGQYSDGTYNPYDVGLDNSGMLQYVNKMKELMGKGMVLTSSIAGESNIVAEFAKGNVAMVLYGLWSSEYWKNAGINYGIAPLPNHKNGKPSQPLTTVQGFVVNSETRNIKGVNAFLEYIMRDNHQQTLIEAGNRFSAKTGERNSSNIAVINSDYIKNDEIMSNLSLIGYNCEPFPNIPEGTIWYNYTTTSFRKIFFGDSNGNPVDAEKALTELADIIRRDVSLMNYRAERIDIPWWVYLIFAVLIAGITAILILRKKAKEKNNPLYIKIQYSKKETLISYCLLLPMLILLSMFYVYPIIHNFNLSLTDYSGINLKDYGFIGFANYADIFTAGMRGLLSMVAWTIVFATSVICLSFLLGTLLATVLDKINIKIAKIYRVIFILPWVIPTVITLLMWQGLLETDGGLVNQILNLIGIPSVPWLSNKHWARISTIFVMTWFSFPYYMVIAFGLLKSIPKDYYEAAKIDGASNAYIFFNITLPLVFKALLPSLIMGFIMQFNQFGIYMLTQGGPASDVLGAPGATDLLITYVFNTAFNTKRYAVAAAYSVIIFVFVGLFALISMRIGKKKLDA